MTDDVESRTIRQVLAALSHDVALLVSQTAALARTELGIATVALRGAVVGIAIGVFLLILAVLVMLATLVLVLIALGLPPWAAAGVITLLLLLGGGGLVALYVRRLLRAPIGLPATRQSVGETVAWLKSQTNP